ncbi:MAG: hypothetical protein KFH87_14170 [Bacteroidetes bacterium]|nr:hypothetical protein [Bacteroidota bacterium]
MKLTVEPCAIAKGDAITEQITYSAIGMGAVISFTPRHVLRVLPLYEIENVREKIPFFSLRAEFAIRM